ncbi:MAG: rod shape-determining protein [Deltaproteobacteria bacterium]|jgi:hypothetical protein|nr:rod shape-determining protein [Deltaproteobacteria bacterium]
MTKRNPKDVLGVDFGTTNTYITICPYGTKNKMPLHLNGRTPAIDTAILYSDANDADRSVFPIIGESATVTYGQADPTEMERAGYRYYSGFKPDIVKNQMARTAFLDFFAAVERDALANGTPLLFLDSQVIFGAPSEAPEEFSNALKELAGKAGFGRVEVVDEPKGALITDLGYGRFPLTDILDGYLVVDFGGGTCDFAYLREGEVERSWGEMELGGRLFDDLFFQWFLDGNPGALAELKAARRDFYALSYLARRLKEDFSETVSRNPAAVVKAELGRFGAVGKLTRGEFLERASSYSPSSAFLDYQRKFGTDPSPAFLNGPVNLLEWFSRGLAQGLGDLAAVKAVSLAGGSSRWFFVKEILLKTLDLDAKRVLNSPNPFGAISEGLSILPAVKADFEDVLERIRAARESFLRNDIARFVRESLESASRKLVSRVLEEFFEGGVAPALKSRRGEGLNIGRLEREIEALSLEYAPRLKSLFGETLKSQFETVRLVSLEKIREWLRSFNLSAASKIVYDLKDPGEPRLDLLLGDQLAEPLFLAAGGALSAVAGFVSASVCGGAGLALLASGPLGLVVGAAGGAAVSGAFLLMGKERLMERLKDRDLPAFLSPLVLSDRVLNSVRERLGRSLEREFKRLFSSSEAAFTREMDKVITAVMERIGIVNVFLEKQTERPGARGPEAPGP